MERNRKEKVKTAVLLLNPKFCFLRMPKIRQLIPLNKRIAAVMAASGNEIRSECITVDGFCGKFSLFRPESGSIFGELPRREWVKHVECAS